MGQFPDILLLWIGHNSVGGKWQADAWTDELSTELSDVFARRYEVQLRRLLDAALGKNSRSAFVVFGLINFGARVEGGYCEVWAPTQGVEMA